MSRGLLSRIRGRSKRSGSKADKLKLWCVRRWLHLMSYPELKTITDDRWVYEQFNKAYINLSNAMIENYYKASITESGE